MKEIRIIIRDLIKTSDVYLLPPKIEDMIEDDLCATILETLIHIKVPVNESILTSLQNEKR